MGPFCPHCGAEIKGIGVSDDELDELDDDDEDEED